MVVIDEIADTTSWLSAAPCAGPKTPQQRETVRLAPSYRSGRHYGAFMTIFVIALAFAVTAPLILPIAGVRPLPLLVPVTFVGPSQCVRS